MINTLTSPLLWAAASAAAGGTTAARGMAGCFVDPGNPGNARTQMVGGKAVFENDNYRISAGDDNEVLIQNKSTGETYRAWGDPHMDIDGKHMFDFWGTTTFVLDDGTKVTIETTPWGNNPNATLSSKVTITQGDYGVQITGVDTNTVGDLAIDEGQGWGRLVDLAVDDGNVLIENTFGQGFLAVDGQGRIRQVDQQHINETDLLKGGALKQRYEGAFRMLEGLIAISFLGTFLGAPGSPSSASHRSAPTVPQPRLPDLGPIDFPFPSETAGPLFAMSLNR